jgi:hypothetical protein
MVISGFAAATAVTELQFMSASQAIYASNLQLGAPFAQSARNKRSSQLNRNFIYEQKDCPGNGCGRAKPCRNR